MIINIPDNAVPDETVTSILHNTYITADSIIFGTDEEVIAHVVEPNDADKLYTITAQVNSMFDEFLSVIPDIHRTRTVMKGIHLIIERFLQLREKFSIFDTTGNVKGIIYHGAMHKPLADHLAAMNQDIRWIVPVTVNRRKLFDVDIIQDTMPDILSGSSDNTISNINIIQENYANNQFQGNIPKYNNMIINLENEFSTFDSPLTTHNIMTGIHSPVLTGIDTIIDSLDNFNSSAIENNKLTRQRFVVQRYNIGQPILAKKEGGAAKRKLFVRSQLTNADNMSVKSLLVLPESIVRIIGDSMPSSNILNKSSGGNVPILLFQLLRKNIDIPQILIESLDNEIEYDSGINVKRKRLGNNPIPFIAKNTISELAIERDLLINAPEDIYKKFLISAIPNTIAFIEHVSQIIPSVYSISGLIRRLEPYMIYSDDIIKEHRTAASTAIRTAIKSYKHNTNEKGKGFRIYRTTNFGVNIKDNIIESLLKTNTAMHSTLEEYRNFMDLNNTENILSNGEYLSRIREIDYGKLFIYSLKFDTISLQTPKSFIVSDTENTKEVEDMNALEKIVPSDCSRRFIAKRYLSIEDMHKDNNEIIFYDKEFDDSPYNILAEYKDQRARITPDVFEEFLEKTLVALHDCPIEIARELAMTLISGKKMVQDHEYAVLEIRPALPKNENINKMNAGEREAIEIESNVRKILSYYRRINNHWVADTTVDEKSFVETNALFCNSAPKCVKNTKSATCDDMKIAALRERGRGEKEALLRFNKSSEDTRESISIDIQRSMIMMNRGKPIKLFNRMLANNTALGIMKTFIDIDVRVSPYYPLITTILAQDDFVKKQNDIIRFVNNIRICREPMLSVKELNESPYWLYCVETNKKLIPRFLYTLATTFILGKDYKTSEEAICRAQGVLSDDNDAIIDKYSGYTICKISFSEEEGFTEAGFKITTNSIIEKGIDTIVAEELNRDLKINEFDSEESITINNIFAIICSNIGVSTDLIAEFVLRMATTTIDLTIIKKDKYETNRNKIIASMEKKAVPPVYDTYRNQMIIFTTAAVLLIAIQTSVPPFRPKITSPGCIMSFSGYPLDGGDSDIQGITYIACVLHKLKSAYKPWDSINSTTSKNMVIRIHTIISNYIMVHADSNGISQLYAKKRDYILVNPADDIPLEHNVINWERFMPPMMPFSVKSTIHGISDNVKHDLMEMLKSGNKKQIEHILAIRSNITLHTYGIVELINEIVSKKTPIFKTSSNVPFVQNACCSDIVSMTTLNYFIEDNPVITRHINAIQKLGEIISNIKDCSIPTMYFHPTNTAISRPSPQTSRFSENIYTAFIRNCKFDSAIPIPAELRGICPTKPDNTYYSANWSLTEKIAFFTRTGKVYSENDLENLMTAINKVNTVIIRTSDKYDAVMSMINLLEHLYSSASVTVEPILCKYIENVVADYSPSKMFIQDNNHAIALKNYLIGCNKKMGTTICDFIYKYGNIKDTNKSNIANVVNTYSSWKIDTEQMDTGLYYEEGFYSAVNCIRNSVYDMAKIFPNIIINEKKLSVIPRHWDISVIHQRDIHNFLNKYYSQFYPFFKDSILSIMLIDVQTRLVDIIRIMDNISILTPIHKGGKTYYQMFDKKTVLLLMHYCWLSTLYEYIQMSDDVDLIKRKSKAIHIMSETNRREMLDEPGVVDSVYIGEHPDLIDASMELDDIQIYMGNHEELKSRVAKLLMVYIDIARDVKKYTDVPYSVIESRVRSISDKEKKGITDSLKNMTPDERKADYGMKKLKLGRWSLGLQKGIVQYDKSMYDLERETGNELFDDNTISFFDNIDNNDDTVAIMVSVDDMDKSDENDADMEDNYERNNISMLGEDYHDNYDAYGDDDDDEYSDN
jgi:hypothetical protein